MWAEDVDKIEPATRRRVGHVAATFYHLASHLIEGREEEAGHDLWLTAVGHGAGFWDGDWPEHGEYLTTLAGSVAGFLEHRHYNDRGRLCV